MTTHTNSCPVPLCTVRTSTSFFKQGKIPCDVAMSSRTKSTNYWRHEFLHCCFNIKLNETAILISSVLCLSYQSYCVSLPASNLMYHFPKYNLRLTVHATSWWKVIVSMSELMMKNYNILNEVNSSHKLEIKILDRSLYVWDWNHEGNLSNLITSVVTT